MWIYFLFFSKYSAFFINIFLNLNIEQSHSITVLKINFKIIIHTYCLIWGDNILCVMILDTSTAWLQRLSTSFPSRSTCFVWPATDAEVRRRVRSRSWSLVTSANTCTAIGTWFRILVCVVKIMWLFRQYLTLKYMYRTRKCLFDTKLNFSLLGELRNNSLFSVYDKSTCQNYSGITHFLKDCFWITDEYITTIIYDYE